MTASDTLPEESSYFTSLGHPFPTVCIRTSTERPEAMKKGCIFIASIDEKTLLQTMDTAVKLNLAGATDNRCNGISVPDYVDESVSTKMVKLIQSHVNNVNRMVWRKF